MIIVAIFYRHFEKIHLSHIEKEIVSEPNFTYRKQ